MHFGVWATASQSSVLGVLGALGCSVGYGRLCYHSGPAFGALPAGLFIACTRGFRPGVHVLRSLPLYGWCCLVALRLGVSPTWALFACVLPLVSLLPCALGLRGPLGVAAFRLLIHSVVSLESLEGNLGSLWCR